MWFCSIINKKKVRNKSNSKIKVIDSKHHFTYLQQADTTTVYSPVLKRHDMQLQS